MTIALSSDNRFREQILLKTLGEIRTFLDEIANGTSNYRSLHSLTEQIEHQYHGRYLIELIQNAHDALVDPPAASDQRIEIRIVEDEKPYGALYVANDGRPFTDSNFKSLAKLGQSDKNPEESIGNKGIGFRSVLEITSSPQIYSRKESQSPWFDGFCFQFSPEVKKEFNEPFHRLQHGESNPLCPLGKEDPLVEWSESKLESFRRNCEFHDTGWLQRELQLLSPYLLPVPLTDEQKTPYLADLEKRGFATVIRLPFASEKARLIAEDKALDMDLASILFLAKVGCFTIAVGDDYRKMYRTVSPIEGDREGGRLLELHVETNDGKGKPQTFMLWERLLGGIDDPEGSEKVRAAILASKLPGKWPDIEKAKVVLAVKLSDVTEKGLLNIYLPTTLTSGCGAHFSAPFYGDMSRTDIDFSKPYNALLLNTLAEKTSNIVLNSLAGKEIREGTAIIDLLSPSADVAGNRWWKALTSIWTEKGIDIVEEKICLTDTGWEPLNCASLLSKAESPKVLSDELLRLTAQYSVFIECLSSRENQIKCIYERINIKPFALEEQIANTIENAATHLHASADEGDWNGFWQDVEGILDGKASSLQGKKVLLGTDGQLHASGESSTIFFRPIKLGTDDEILSEDAIDEIPEKLRPFIAFLNDSIIAHTIREKGGYEPTSVNKFLSTDLVKRFGIEQILRVVLLPAIPPLPVSLDSEDGKLCCDILRWGLKLIQSLVARDKGGNLSKLLARFPAPCRGGWYQLSETTFGPGWNLSPDDNTGSDLEVYLNKVATSECRETYNKLLLPPSNHYWGEMSWSFIDLLEDVGVSRGLQPKVIKSSEWKSKFSISGYSKVELPETSPPGFEESCWREYRSQISQRYKPRFSGSFEYLIKDLYTLPGLDRYGEFDEDLRAVFMRVLFAAISSWQLQGKWENLVIKKEGGETHSYDVESPLKFFLMKTAWLVDEQEGSFSFFQPGERWFVPSSTLAGRSFQFSHLNPIPPAMVRILEREHNLPGILESLGMPKFDLEKSTSNTRLLDDHANALVDPDIVIANRDVFLGMVRNAWNQYVPEGNSKLPERMIVRCGTEGLKVVTPSRDNPVYLPDATEALHEGLEFYTKPIVAIESKDAKRLRDTFLQTLGDSVQLASRLTIKPVCDGKAWEGGKTELLNAQGIEWLPPVVLAVFAYAGQQSSGTGTKTFQKASDTLRSARAVWFDTLEIGLWRDDFAVVTIPVGAYWHAQGNLLFAIREGKHNPGLLSDAIAVAVERADLPVYLKFVLGKLASSYEPDQNEISLALREIGVSQDRFLEVQQRWLGNLSWTIRMVRPIIRLLVPGADLATLAGINSEDQLTGYLSSLNLHNFDWADTLEQARCANDFQQIGKFLFKAQGEIAQLDKWNAVLASLDEIPIEISETEEEFSQHMASVRKSFRAVIRQILKDSPAAGRFVDLEDQLFDLSCPEDWTRRFWEIDFQNVMAEMAANFGKIGAKEAVINTITHAQSLTGLKTSLIELGIDTKIDPMEVHAENIASLSSLKDRLQKTAIFWCDKNKISLGMWEPGTNSFREHLRDYLDVYAYLETWDESQCLQILMKLPRDEKHSKFWEAIDAASDMAGVLDALGINDQDLRKVGEIIKNREQEAERAKRMVDVCGFSFENTSDNLVNLWHHLEQTITDDKLAGIDINKQVQLKPQKIKESSHSDRKENKTDRTRGKSPGRMTQAMKNLIGLVGEIHVYRHLQKAFGKDIVGPDCWVSENSKNKFPQNRTDDGFGCDFEVSINSKTHYIEVKATIGEDETFELGSSEIRLAVDLANKSKRVFSIIHVMNALSTQPKILILPNPYSKKYRSMYKIENAAGLKIRYETK